MIPYSKFTETISHINHMKYQVSMYFNSLMNDLKMLKMINSIKGNISLDDLTLSLFADVSTSSFMIYDTDIHIDTLSNNLSARISFMDFINISVSLDNIGYCPNLMISSTYSMSDDITVFIETYSETMIINGREINQILAELNIETNHIYHLYDITPEIYANLKLLS